MGRATFDVQRDHADLIRMTARRLLAPGGILLFATNRRGFKLDHGELGGLEVKDLSRATLPFDCARGANRHHVFRWGRPAALTARARGDRPPSTACVASASAVTKRCAAASPPSARDEHLPPDAIGRGRRRRAAVLAERADSARRDARRGIGRRCRATHT